MSILQILKYPDKRLHNFAKPVLNVDYEIRQLADDMAETMYEASGIGLAATQVNELVRVVVIDVSDSRDELLVLINPEVYFEKGVISSEEGCLSVPNVYDQVERAEDIKVRALDRAGQIIDFEATGILSICIQHEIDHLDGKVFVEYLSRLKQDRIVKKLKKRQEINDG
jgi:peptide deformylase